MTPQEINIAVAKKLGMDWDKFHVDERICPVHDYCGSIAAALEIADRLDSPLLVPGPEGSDIWHFYFYSKNYKCISAAASTAPMAICLAFLKLP